MARYTYIPNRVIDTNGISDGANIYFYATGTLTPVTVYSDAALTTPVSNPYPVAAGAAVPALYYAEDDVRVRVVDSGGSVISDDDPWSAIEPDAIYLDTGDDVQAAFNGYATRTALKALTSYAGGRAYLTESGRAGEFVFRSGDYSAEVTADTQEGIYIKADDAATTSGAWVRQYDGPVNAAWFGAVGDNLTVNTTALQVAMNVAALDTDATKSLYIPAGEYLTGTLYVPLGLRLFGDTGASETTAQGGSRLIQSGSGDVLRFESLNNGSLYYWYGEIDHLEIFGDNTEISGWGINFKDVSGNNVIPQDSNFLHHLAVRRCYEGGINVPAGAFPMCIHDCKFLFNNGPGIKLTRSALFQGVHFLNISGDGNNGGLISLNTLNDTYTPVVITNLKSEARVNADYGSAEHQTRAIECTSCNDLPIIINGAAHISSIPDGGNFKKPGDLVYMQSGGTPPKVMWNGVSIRVRGSDTGTDPVIVGGSGVSPTISQAAYTEPFGVFNASYRFFNTRVLFSRATASDGDTTPSVAKQNLLLLNNTGATTITNLDDGTEGQLVVLVFNNANTTIADNANIFLNAGVNWNAPGNATLTLIYSASKWIEIGRGHSAQTGAYAISNVTTDRAMDANATTLDEVADVLGTLIADLTTRGVIG